MTHMARIAESFQILFTAVTEEADRLGSWYAPLGERVRAVIGDAADDELLGPEAVRLVQVFEDPQVLGDVRTIHGLKRYLHQSGLRSAFRLFQNRRATNRTVDIAVLSGRRILQVTDCIRYLDFEPEAGVASTALPFPVALAALPFAGSVGGLLVATVGNGQKTVIRPATPTSQ